MTELTAKTLRKILSYDPLTGEWRHLTNGNGFKIGWSAGGLCTNGYWYIGINRRRYCAHRLAWLYMTGRWPRNEIDHINRDKSDNRFVNLREATHHENSANAAARKNNKSRFKGVRKHKDGRRWSAAIIYRGRQKWLGLFDSAEDAAAAYTAAADTFYGEFASD